MNKTLFAPKAVGLAFVLGVSVGFSPALLGFNNKTQLLSMIDDCEHIIEGNVKDKRVLEILKQKIKSGKVTLLELMCIVSGVSQKTKDIVLKKARELFPSIDRKNDTAAGVQLSNKIIQCVSK